MKRLFFLLTCVLIGSALCGQTVHNSKYTVKKGRIVFDAPKRAKGQQSMLGFAAVPIPVVRVGIIGLGMRGPGAVTRLGFIDNVEIRALCDLYPERIEENQQILEKAAHPGPTNTAARRVGNSSANATTSTWCTSSRRGFSTSRWPSTPWNTANTSPSRFPPPKASPSAGSWSTPPNGRAATA